MKMKTTIWGIVLLVLMGCGKSGISEIEKMNQMSSPDGTLEITVSLNNEGQPYYTVSKNYEVIMDTSLMGLNIEGEDFSGNFKIENIVTSKFDETWEQPWGEERWIRNHYNELLVNLAGLNDDKRMSVRFRVYNDGVGFRYEFGDDQNNREMVVLDELTEFNLSEDPMAWWIDATWRERYESLYKNTRVSEIPTIVHTPFTMKTDNGLHISIHEAALINYTSTTLQFDGTKISTNLVPYDSTGKVKAYITTPSKTPWRTIQVAENAGELMTSYLILNLNEPNALGDVSWFKPGKYIGIWWELHLAKSSWAPGPKHGATTENTKKYIDFAAEHGFDAVLVEGWNKGWEGDWVMSAVPFSFTEPYPDYDLEELTRYAAEKGVYIVGHHETSANVDNYEPQMADAFQLLEDHGMKAVKTGYVEHGNLLRNGKSHHGQAYIEHFRRVIELAAKHKVAVIAHEPIKATGVRRTFPNMISREGARGQEFNAWGGEGGNPPEHTLILPFTRFLGGPMDFTPGVFDITLPDKPDNQINTTLAKQLALYVTIYSPMQMACDLPENYMKYPDAFEFIKEVGVDWETTKVLDAVIGDYLVVARKERVSENWFVGAITDENSRDIEIRFDFLEEGKVYKAKIYRDADDADYQDNPESYIIEEKEIKKDDILNFSLARSGGVAIAIGY